MIQLFNKTKPNIDDNARTRQANEIDNKYKAALALNFCTVSVSQIIDYDDLYILEQEYEGILNNLNLKAFPKDDALLDILRKILDTITFFRIQEGDKVFIERDYQQKMKNAIWSSAPNLVAVLATGNPVAMAVTLASQIGIGYMNYRREKADNTLEYEKEKWQLQRTAIDQFNALRRELFSTAWRLARDYDFPDEYRLTESQITMYNAILMDSDPMRRYERLSSIQDDFVAYPPFWYYLGRSAFEVALEYDNASIPNAKSIAEQFKKQALAYYEAFRRMNDNDLLRSNPIATACYLDHVEILSSDNKHNHHDEIKELLNLTVKKAGTSLDVIQICAINYLKIGEYNLAEKFLMKCIVENFNSITNAQLLSCLYYKRITEERDNQSIRIDYLKLQRFVGDKYLFPLPAENEHSLIEVQNAKFLEVQKEILQTKFILVAKRVLEKYSIQLKRDLQTPTYKRDYPNSYYSESNKEIRIHDIKQICASKAKDEYLGLITQFDINSTIVSYISDFLDALTPLFKQAEMHDAIEQAKSYRLKKATENEFTIEWTDSNPGRDEYIESICDISLERIFGSYIEECFVPALVHLLKQKAISIEGITSLEGILTTISTGQEIETPVELYRKTLDREERIPDLTPARLFSFGDDQSIERQKREDVKRRMKDAIKDSVTRGLVQEGRIILEEDHRDLVSYFNIHSKNIPEELKEDNKNKNILAIFTIGNNSIKKDIVFTVQSVYSFYGKIRKAQYDILNASLDLKTIVLESKENKPKEFYSYRKLINMQVFNELIKELRSIAIG